MISRNVSCAEDMIQCNNSECILAVFLCDGHSDCHDGSDEDSAVCGKIIMRSLSYSIKVLAILGSNVLLQWYHNPIVVINDSQCRWSFHSF